jgi:adenosylcobyric acid synthase
MLGQRIEDDAGVDGCAEGLGLLPLRTKFAAPKRTDRVSTCFQVLSGPWAALGGKPVAGYQIRHGRSTTTAAVDEALPGGLGFVSGSVLGIYLHGLFEEPGILAALFHDRPRRTLDQAFDELADAIEEHLDVSFLLREAGVR